MNIRIGITGGIGVGKSYVCHLLQQRSIPIFDCDSQAQRLMQTDHILRESLTQLIGPNTYLGDKLNRSVVARYLFSDTAHAVRINSLVHPRVRTEFLSWADAQSSDIVGIESAILYQCHFDDLVEAVVLVTAPLPVRIHRIAQRDGLSHTEILQRIQAQEQPCNAPSSPHPQFHILNDGLLDLTSQIDELLRQITRNTKS